ncbi:MAG TPA: phosphoribosyltransferase family protein [Candidatus Methylomirabilis sp.]|nr:phosphoribosyltransferase family protein [Candidatus Methylomirabilis sp.]
MTTTHPIQIGSVRRDLPVREVAPGIRVALFNVLGDWELTEALGFALAKLVPTGTDMFIMPDGKAQSLLHVLGRVTSLPTIVARKEHKPYMRAPVLSVRVKSITTDRVQELHLGDDDVQRLAGRRVAIVDDVVSTGGTLDAMRQLLDQARAIHAGTLAAFTEGEPRNDVISLGHLPLY